MSEFRSLDSTMIDHRLSARGLLLFLLMLANHVMHQRKGRDSGHAILDCMPPNGEAKVGATLLRLPLEVASGTWILASLPPKALLRDARDSILR